MSICFVNLDVCYIAQCMLENCGYKQAALRRQGKTLNKWCDDYIYGMLAREMDREDWAVLHSVIIYCICAQMRATINRDRVMCRPIACNY